MKTILNKRLEKLSAFINQEDNVLDIGCDHGLLGISLCMKYKNIKIVSSDINEKPLAKAIENIKKYHFEDRIDARLGDGLKVMSNDINTVVISGMGGTSIINILNNINDYPNVKKLILSPNNDFSLVRKEITKKGFYIVKEEMVCEKNKFYLISEYQIGKNNDNYFFGKLNLADVDVKRYYQYIYNTNKEILNNLSLINKIKKFSLIKENYLIKKKISIK